MAGKAGIPTRAIGGINIFTSHGGSDTEPSHTWNQVFVPNIGWVDIDAVADDDDKAGEHRYKYVGVRRNVYFITFEGAYDRRNYVDQFIQRSWFSDQWYKSKDPKNPARLVGQAPTVIVRNLSSTP